MGEERTKVTFNGLKDVPTGPARSMKQAPHVFISAEWVPPNTHNQTHLHNCMRRYSPADVLVDDSGFYIVFEDGVAGRALVDMCVNGSHMFRLFNKYPLHMQAYPNGQSGPSTQTAAPAPRPRLDRADPTRAEDVIGGTATTASLSQPHRVQITYNSRSADPKAAKESVNGFESQQRGSTDEPPTPSAQAQSRITEDRGVPALRQSSPLHVPSRQDKDDASSVSGKTTASSDISSSKRVKCHVCNDVSQLDIESLVLCSSCPRRYHRRCHHTPPITSDAGEDRSWQCRRCVKKQIKLSAPRPDVSAKADASSALQNVGLDGRTEKRPKVQDSGKPEDVPKPVARAETHATATFQAIKNTSMTFRTFEHEREPLKPKGSFRGPDRAEATTSALDTVSAGTRTSDGEAPKSTTETSTAKQQLAIVPEEQSQRQQQQPNSEDSHFDEALDLVEKTFASADKSATAAAVPTHKPAKLKLVHKKIARPLQAQSPLPAKDAHLPALPADSRPTSPADKLATQPAVQSASKARGQSNTASANLDIIEAPSLRDTSFTTKATKVSEALNSSIGMRESPQSGHLSGKNDAQKVVAASETPASASPVDSAVQSELVSVDVAPTKLTAKRTKPTVVNCTRCKKSTWCNNAFGMALCLDCKRQRAAEASVGEGVSTGPSAPPIQSVADESLNPEPEKVLGGEKRHQQSSEQTPVPAQRTKTTREASQSGADHAESPSPARAMHGMSRTACDDCSKRNMKCVHFAVPTTGEASTSGVACDKCKRHHKKCVHVSSVEGAPMPSLGLSKAGLVPDAISGPEMQATVDDLNLWKTSQLKNTEARSKEAESDSQAPRKVHIASRAKRSDRDEQNTPAPRAPEPDSTMTQIDGDTSDGDLSEPPSTPGGEAQAGSSNRIRRNFTGGVGLGDSWERPIATYGRLIGMALCDAPDGRLQQRGICHWIAANIPDYTLGVSAWENGISVTLGAHAGDKGRHIYKQTPWRTDESDEHGKGGWYQLQSRFIDKHERWDPVLKKPVSPSQEWQSQDIVVDGDDSMQRSDPNVEQALDEHEMSPSDVVRDRFAKARVAGAAKAARRKRMEQVRGEVAVPGLDDHMEVDAPDALSGGLQTDDRTNSLSSLAVERTESSDDEPLANVRRNEPRKFTIPAATMQPSPVSVQEEVTMDDAMDETMDVDTMSATDGEQMWPASKVTRPKPQPRRIDTVQVDHLSLAQLIKLEAENIDYSAKSLYDEWPEYHPEKQFDKIDKIAEIKQRPTRKQMFKKPAMYSRLASNEAAKSLHSAVKSRSNSVHMSAEQTSRSPRRQSSYNRSGFEDKVKHFDTLKEFFDLPANPIPFIYNEQLAYRDGTRDESGKLPRAKTIYKTGPR